MKTGGNFELAVCPLPVASCLLSIAHCQLPIDL